MVKKMQIAKRAVTWAGKDVAQTLSKGGRGGNVGTISSNGEGLEDDNEEDGGVGLRFLADVWLCFVVFSLF